MVEKRTYYWDTISEEIGKLLIRYFKSNMRICEIGFASGHFLEFLYSEGYLYLSGIEVRYDEYKKVINKFMNQDIQIELVNKNVLEIDKTYDAIFATGLIQCFDETDRNILLKHLSRMAPIAIYTVPEIKELRNESSAVEVAVIGCKEFCTANIGYELNKYYSEIKIGRIDKNKTKSEENLIYFLCRREQ